MLLNQFPEVFLSNKKIANRVARELKKGNIRKISARLYTTNLKDSRIQTISATGPIISIISLKLL
ncbi:MAG: hypothetical protein K2W92_03805 [Alphaproteobacteria bacterium]|nr:hypothetical protein [Alphaproteobacteria bacterium]